MSKAILIMDMPENCEDCQFGEIIECGKTMCNIKHRSLPMVSYRPHWCSLLPEPEKHATYDSKHEHSADYYLGWNACIDALEGNNKDENK